MWNACGGKIEEGETPLACAIREVSEESGLKVSNLVYHGKEVAHLPDKEFLIHIYSTTIFEGELLKDSPEGELHWFPINEIPFEQMWPDDTFWLLPMLRGARFDAEFWYLPDKILERCHFELY